TSIRQSNLRFWVGLQLEFGPSIRGANQDVVQGMAGDAQKRGTKSALTRVTRTAHPQDGP
ncbi:MAG: hypothetical protein P8Q23_08945, partial [Paracoccaceae bacterium]|nr:hypothetical protein [Paracoccaceae bacterium]